MMDETISESSKQGRTIDRDKRKLMEASEGKEATTSAVSTYLEKFGDPTELEDKGKVPFGEVLQYSLGLVGRHVLVRFEAVREAIAILYHVDALVAKVTDDEHVRWYREEKERDPELGVGDACKDCGKYRVRNELGQDGSHQGHLPNQRHRCLHNDTGLDDLKEMC